jgi:hypothetical protein
MTHGAESGLLSGKVRADYHLQKSYISFKSSIGILTTEELVYKKGYDFFYKFADSKPGIKVSPFIVS